MAHSRLDSKTTGHKIAAYGEALRYFREVVIPYEGDECLLWPFSCDGFGYAQVYWRGRVRRAHRVLCKMEHGEPPSPRHEAAHRCGRGHEGCVARKHLEWDTRLGNQSDRKRHGTHIKGERHGMARLTESQVREIFALKGLEPLAETAARYGIGKQHASDIQNGKKWGWLTSQQGPLPTSSPQTKNQPNSQP